MLHSYPKQKAVEMKVIIDRHADRLQDNEHSEKTPVDPAEYEFTNYELWQLEKYGKIINKSQDPDEDDGILELNRLSEYFEYQLLKDHP